MRPVLDDLELLQVQEISELGRRALAEHKPPGMPGSLLQDLGRDASRFTVSGVATGPASAAFVERLEQLFERGEPVPFTADITTDAGIDEVLIDDLRLEELAGRPQRLGYRLVLVEHVEPVSPAAAAGLLDADILADALGLVDSLTAGLEIIEQLSAVAQRLTALNDALGKEGTAVLFGPD